MSKEQNTPNGGSISPSPQGDGDNRPMKSPSGGAQKAVDATSSEPRDLPRDGQSGSGDPDANGERRT
jgi:hypothetical protein